MVADIRTGKQNGDLVLGPSTEALSTSANGWPMRPFQIVSLLEMLNKYAAGFFRLGEMFEGLAAIAMMAGGRQAPPDPAIEERMVRKTFEDLDNLEGWCKTVNLTLSIKSVQWVRKGLKETPTLASLEPVIPELQRRVFDELDSVWFLDVPPDRVKCYENSQLFGEEVTNKITNVDTDIAEAGSCFATSRYTACVFHLMRVMERATQELGSKLGIQLTTEKNWQNILDEVNKAIRAMNPQTPQDRDQRDNFSAAAAHLHNVKEAWRNRVMHPKQTYTEDEAKAVMDNVRTFVVHLARNVL